MSNDKVAATFHGGEVKRCPNWKRIIAFMLIGAAIGCMGLEVWQTVVACASLSTALSLLTDDCRKP